MFSDTWDDHTHRIGPPFSCLAEARLTANLTKCEFVKVTVTHPGWVVGQDQVHPVDTKVQEVTQYPVPATKKELMQFLSLVNYYYAFSTVAAPLIC